MSPYPLLRLSRLLPAPPRLSLFLSEVAGAIITVTTAVRTSVAGNAAAAAVIQPFHFELHLAERASEPLKFFIT
jgi:hypothetical protein